MIVRELFAKLGLSVDEQSFATGQIAVDGVRFALTKIVDTAINVGKTLVGLATDTIAYAGDLDDTSQAIGLTNTALQELRYAAGVSGVTTDELSTSVRLLSARLSDAAQGGGESASVFQRLGIAVKDATGKLRPADDVLADVAERFAAMDDGAEKTALALELFGRSGTKLIPLLNEGADGLERLRKEAEELGIVLDDDLVKAGAAFGDTLDGLSMTADAMRRAIGKELIPVLLEAARGVREWVKANRDLIKSGLERFGRLLAAVLRVAVSAVKALGVAIEVLRNTWQVVLIGMAAALAPLIVEMTALGIAAVGAAAGTLAAWAAAAAPIILIAGLVSGLLLVLNSFVRYTQGKDSLVGDLLKGMDKWLSPTGPEPWWLTAVKSLVFTIREFLNGGLAEEFSLWIEDTFAFFGSDAARQLKARREGGKVTTADGLTAYVEAPPSLPTYTPSTAPGVGTVMAPRFSVGAINVAVPAGTDAQGVGTVLRRELDSWWDSKMEEASAAAPGG